MEGYAMDRDKLGRLFADAIRTVDCEAAVTDDDWNDESSASERENFCQAGEWFAARIAPEPRVFHARVSLMGHRSIGLCRITEAPLAGVTMLRCEKDGAVEWVNPAAVYSVTEVPDTVAEAEIASALRHAESVRVETEKRESEIREQRSSAMVDVVVDVANGQVGAIANKTGLLRLHDAMLQAALVANGITGYSLSPLDNDAHEPIGFSFYVVDPKGDVPRIVAAMRVLGFSAVNVREAVGDELVESIPF